MRKLSGIKWRWTAAFGSGIYRSFLLRDNPGSSRSRENCVAYFAGACFVFLLIPADVR
jgi:hypothetical protein